MTIISKSCINEFMNAEIRDRLGETARIIQLGINPRPFIRAISIAAGLALLASPSAAQAESLKSPIITCSQKDGGNGITGAGQSESEEDCSNRASAIEAFSNLSQTRQTILEGLLGSFTVRSQGSKADGSQNEISYLDGFNLSSHGEGLTAALTASEANEDFNDKKTKAAEIAEDNN